MLGLMAVARSRRLTDGDSLMIDDSNQGPVYPLLGFRAGIVGGAVALRFDFALSREDYWCGKGESQKIIMTAETAIDIGKALQERGKLARSAAPEFLG